MQMQGCPHCGAENSVRRTKCYQCQGELTATGDGPAPVASSRFEAIERVRGRPARRAFLPAQEAAMPSDPEGRTTPSAVTRAYAPPIRRPLRHVRRMSQFFRELHTMTRSGMAIGPACRELDRRGPRNLRVVARQMVDAAEKGEPISSAMERNRHLFYAWHLGLVRAAEAGGFLPEAFDQIAHA
ncbi:MAG: type II secretion system F family protein, partial [Armatimonadetes bacterium]|nr:type II secretion system F family protein [Armatimonadota bacterium]